MRSRSLANFVGIVVGFLNVCKIRLFASSLPPRYPLKAKWYNNAIPSLITVRISSLLRYFWFIRLTHTFRKMDEIKAR
jgi:hypothetical protein